MSAVDRPRRVYFPDNWFDGLDILDVGVERFVKVCWEIPTKTRPVGWSERMCAPVRGLARPINSDAAPVGFDVRRRRKPKRLGDGIGRELPEALGQVTVMNEAA